MLPVDGGAQPGRHLSRLPLPSGASLLMQARATRLPTAAATLAAAASESAVSWRATTQLEGALHEEAGGACLL